MNTCGGWEAVRQSVRQRIGARAFDAWFGSLEGEIEGATLSIRCPDRFSRDWIRSRYGAVLIPELNSGQLARILRSEYCGHEFLSYPKVQGRPFSTQDLIQRIQSILVG